MATNIRKHLKSCVAKLIVSESEVTDTFQACLKVYEPGKEFGGTFLLIRAQANDLRGEIREADKSSRIFQPAKCIRSFVDVGPFYAIRCDAQVSLRYNMDGYDNADRQKAFFTLISKVIAERNLSYVYPDCELSQVVAALETLGCPLQDVTVNDLDFTTWLRGRKEGSHE